MDTSYLSYQFLDEVMGMSGDTRKRYSKALTLIINTGAKPEDAFKETGFTQAYKEERGIPWQKQTKHPEI